MTSRQGLPYTTPAAFRRALTDKLRVMASTNGPWPLPDLQRQFAYDRLLVRLYLLDDGWILKGSTALLARHIAVRHTIDIDVYRAVSREQAERDLRAALFLDGGDCLRSMPARGAPSRMGRTARASRLTPGSAQPHGLGSTWMSSRRASA